MDLGNNHINDKGASFIAEAIAQSKSLVTVDLSLNSIGDVGASAVAEAIKQNKSLTTVDLGHNEIGDVGAVAIAEAVAQNKSLLTTVNLRRNAIWCYRRVRDRRGHQTEYIADCGGFEMQSKLAPRVQPPLPRPSRKSKSLPEVNVSWNTIS